MGDTIEKVTEATGIKKVVEFIAGEDCGCEERKEKLNKLFPYAGMACLNEGEYQYLSSFQPWKKVSLEMKDQQALLDIYNRVFSKRKTISRCSKCWVNIIKDLKGVYDTYEKNE